MKSERILFILATTLLMFSCGKGQPTQQAQQEPEQQPATGEVTDDAMVAASKQGTFTFYKNNSERLAFTPSAGGHSGYIRVRFNEVAQAALGPDGKLPEGGTFPPSSVIVKEIYPDETKPLEMITVMMKAPAAPNSNQGWVWGGYKANGSVAVSASERGAKCVSCHSLEGITSPVAGDLGPRDSVRTFGLRP